MPRFYVDLEGILAANDLVGAEHATAEIAAAEAEQDARAVWAEAILVGRNPKLITLSLRDDKSRVIRQFTFDSLFPS